ncbi:hypothetical protein [Marinobacter mobilis]|uniref:Uncharacterized protein n=1 Tax=Marinobacter mobilis TaxID=488533 RepID=A0A1H2XYN9_9GAMM|nr:hypothetical protein [Marinobacter mobilis]SDW97987.1 hypothetical protein SAMN04487960_105202 [Marinobacter mobilis]
MQRAVLWLFQGLVLGGLMLPGGIVAAAACPQPQSDYERVYCEIIAGGGGGSLPSFEDFRRNSLQVQALLLKRPAARLGIDLAVPERATPVAAEPAPQPRSVEPVATADPQRLPEPQGMQGCSLQGEVIDCGHRRYRLATNQPNGELASGVLAESNRLGLVAFSGDSSNEAELRQYLSDAYDRYILKMLEIGLGGATMSFSEFYHNFQRHQARGVDYSERMEQTFQLLKEDKRTKVVPSRLTDRLPQSLTYCSGIGARVVVCDDVGTNWVFVTNS